MKVPRSSRSVSARPLDFDPSDDVTLADIIATRDRTHETPRLPKGVNVGLIGMTGVAFLHWDGVTGSRVPWVIATLRQVALAKIRLLEQEYRVAQDRDLRFNFPDPRSPQSVRAMIASSGGSAEIAALLRWSTAAPAEVLRQIRLSQSAFPSSLKFELPIWLDEAVIAWLIHVATFEGGGNGKIPISSLRELLEHPHKLAARIRKFSAAREFSRRTRLLLQSTAARIDGLQCEARRLAVQANAPIGGADPEFSHRSPSVRARWVRWLFDDCRRAQHYCRIRIDRAWRDECRSDWSTSPSSRLLRRCSCPAKKITQAPKPKPKREFAWVRPLRAPGFAANSKDRREKPAWSRFCRRDARIVDDVIEISSLHLIGRPVRTSKYGCPHALLGIRR